MNTGLHDVWNLVWKIDLSVRGHANARLLDTYSAERLPVIKGVIGMTDLMTKVMGTPNRFAQALRNTVIPMVSHLAPFQHAFVERLSELGIAYGGSPIIEGDGRRYFDETIRGGSGIGSRFILFVGREAAPRAREAAAALCTGLGDLTELRDGAGEDITLVRPDGYVACAVRRPDTPSALGPLRTLIERQITPGSAVQQPRHTPE